MRAACAETHFSFLYISYIFLSNKYTIYIYDDNIVYTLEEWKDLFGKLDSDSEDEFEKF